MRKDIPESAELESPEGGRKEVVQITGGRQVSDYTGAFSRERVGATAVGEIGDDGKVNVDATLESRQFRYRIHSAAREGDATVDLVTEDGQRLPEERVEAIVNLDQEVQRLDGKKLTYTGLSAEGAGQIQRALGGSDKRAFSKRKSGEALKPAA